MATLCSALSQVILPLCPPASEQCDLFKATSTARSSPGAASLRGQWICALRARSPPNPLLVLRLLSAQSPFYPPPRSARAVAALGIGTWQLPPFPQPLPSLPSTALLRRRGSGGDPSAAGAPGFVTPLCLLTFNRLFIPELLFKLPFSATGPALFTKQSGLLLFLLILCYNFYLFSPLNSGRCDFPDPPSSPFSEVGYPPFLFTKTDSHRRLRSSY